MISKTPRKRGNQWLVVAVSTIAVVGLLYAFVDPAILSSLLKELSIAEIASLAGVYSGAMILRIVRIRLSFSSGSAPSFPQISYASVIHQFLNHIVPARLGEISLPLLLKQRNQVPITQSVAMLLVLRLFDLIVLMLFGLVAIALLIQNQIGSDLNKYLTATAIGGVLLLVCLLWYGFVYRFKLEAPDQSQASPGRIAALSYKIRAFAAEVQKELRSNWSPLKHAVVFSFSCLIWITLLAFFHAFLHFANHDVAYWQTLVGSTFASLTQLLPVNSLGSIGTLEAGWSAGFYLTGIPIQTGVATGFLMHTLVILYLVLVAGLFKIVDLLSPKPANTPARP